MASQNRHDHKAIHANAMDAKPKSHVLRKKESAQLNHSHSNLAEEDEMAVFESRTNVLGHNEKVLHCCPSPLHHAVRASVFVREGPLWTTSTLVTLFRPEPNNVERIGRNVYRHFLAFDVHCSLYRHNVRGTLHRVLVIRLR